MTWALVRAADKTGIGLTMLPTLYMNQGFGQSGLNSMQRRFESTPESILNLQQAVVRQTKSLSKKFSLNAGVAIHSLRAVAPTEIQSLTSHSGAAPVHIHIAEQSKEVADCIAHTGLRPVECLLANANLDKRWNLVHATHTSVSKFRAFKRSKLRWLFVPQRKLI